jgi:hypothetical protein
LEEGEQARSGAGSRARAARTRPAVARAVATKAWPRGAGVDGGARARSRSRFAAAAVDAHLSHNGSRSALRLRAHRSVGERVQLRERFRERGGGRARNCSVGRRARVRSWRAGWCGAPGLRGTGWCGVPGLRACTGDRQRRSLACAQERSPRVFEERGLDKAGCTSAAGGSVPLPVVVVPRAPSAPAVRPTSPHDSLEVVRRHRSQRASFASSMSQVKGGTD